MHKVLSSYLSQFSRENDLNSRGEAEQFERFVNFCVVNRYFPDQFEIEEVTTGSDDWSIDGAAIIIGDELVLSAEDAASVFGRLRPKQSVAVNYIFVQAKRSEGFDGGEMLKFGTGVASLFSDSTEAPSDPVLHEVAKIHDVVVTNLSKVHSGRPDCLLHYVTTGVWNAPEDLVRIVATLKQQLDDTGLFNMVEFVPVDREGLIAYWIQTRNPVQATFTVKGYIPIPDIEGVEEAYLTITPAVEFVDKVLAGDDGRIRSSVFEQNVRAFLGDDNPVNARIRSGLEDPDSHDRFAILNNGLTLVSPDVRVQADRVSVTDFQIVNGCQTSHVLVRSRSLLTDGIYVPIKVVEADDPDIVAQVVEATNSQSDVEETQFLSLSPFVRKLEAYFNAFESEAERDRRLYFERRTRQYAGEEISRNRIFDIERLARAFAAMFLDVPHLAARYPTQTLKERADALYRTDHREVTYYTAALALYRLELAFGNGYVPRTYQTKKWHLLMAVKYRIGGKVVPPLNSPKIERYCKPILDALEAGGKASAPPFLEAASEIDALGPATRDRVKGQRFTEELRTRITGR